MTHYFFFQKVESLPLKKAVVILLNYWVNQPLLVAIIDLRIVCVTIVVTFPRSGNYARLSQISTKQVRPPAKCDSYPPMV